MDNATGLHECPSCKMPMAFSHPETDILQCPNCRSYAMRKDGVFFKKSFLPITDGNHLIQVGTTGMFNDQLFTVKGRIRTWMQDSVINYWTVIFDDFSIAYLAEGYGMYAIHRKEKSQADYFSVQTQSRDAGVVRMFGGAEYLLLRSEQCIKWEVEGEVMMPYADANMWYFDYASAAGKNMELVHYFGNYIIAYNVQPTSFSDLRLKQTNNLPIEQHTEKCQNCGRPAILMGYPFTHSYSCYGCGTRYAMDYTTNFSKCGSDSVNQDKPLLQLGKKGTINGIDYEVVGYAHKEEMNQYKARWKEYTLYNQAEGFAFLSEYSGHWMYVRETLETPVFMDRKEPAFFSYHGKRFHLFNTYKYKLLDSLGEFPYDAFGHRNMTVHEYISPPEMWIRESGSKEGIFWFHGSYLDLKIVADAFQVGVPYQQGVGAAQPKGNISPRTLLRTTAIIACIMLVIHLVMGFTKQHRIVAGNNYSFGDSTTVSFVTDKFHLDKWRANMEIEISAPVTNSWFELGGTLVNADNGTEYSFEEGVEYYSGYTDGENWSEGSKNSTVYLNSLPPGNYFLQLQGVRSGSDATRPDGFNVSAVYDTQQHKNVIFLIILLLLWPIIKYCIIISNERKRWEDSPFDLYQSTRAPDES